MFKVNYKGIYKSPEFQSFDEAYAFCKKQAPLIVLKNNSYFEIYDDNGHYDITFKIRNGEMVECYRKYEKNNTGCQNEMPIVLHYGGSDQDFFAANERSKAIEKIKEVANKMVGKFVILIHGNDMWKSSYDGKTLHHQPCKLVNGEYINIVT